MKPAPPSTAGSGDLAQSARRPSARSRTNSGSLDGALLSASQHRRSPSSSSTSASGVAHRPRTLSTSHNASGSRPIPHPPPTTATSASAAPAASSSAADLARSGSGLYRHRAKQNHLEQYTLPLELDDDDDAAALVDGGCVDGNDPNMPSLMFSAVEGHDADEEAALRLLAADPSAATADWVRSHSRRPSSTLNPQQMQQRGYNPKPTFKRFDPQRPPADYHHGPAPQFFAAPLSPRSRPLAPEIQELLEDDEPTEVNAATEHEQLAKSDTTAALPPVFDPNEVAAASDAAEAAASSAPSAPAWPALPTDLAATINSTLLDQSAHLFGSLPQSVLSAAETAMLRGGQGRKSLTKGPFGSTAFDELADSGAFDRPIVEELKEDVDELEEMMETVEAAPVRSHTHVVQSVAPADAAPRKTYYHEKKAVLDRDAGTLEQAVHAVVSAAVRARQSPFAPWGTYHEDALRLLGREWPEEVEQLLQLASAAPSEAGNVLATPIGFNMAWRDAGVRLHHTKKEEPVYPPPPRTEEELRAEAEAECQRLEAARLERKRKRKEKRRALNFGFGARRRGGGGGYDDDDGDGDGGDANATRRKQRGSDSSSTDVDAEDDSKGAAAAAAASNGKGDGRRGIVIITPAVAVPGAVMTRPDAARKLDAFKAVTIRGNPKFERGAQTTLTSYHEGIFRTIQMLAFRQHEQLARLAIASERAAWVIHFAALEHYGRRATDWLAGTVLVRHPRTALAQYVGAIRERKGQRRMLQELLRVPTPDGRSLQAILSEEQRADFDRALQLSARLVAEAADFAPPLMMVVRMEETARAQEARCYDAWVASMEHMATLVAMSAARRCSNAVRMHLSTKTALDAQIKEVDAALGRRKSAQAADE